MASEQTLTNDGFKTTREAKAPSKKSAIEYLTTLSKEDREAFPEESYQLKPGDKEAYGVNRLLHFIKKIAGLIAMR